MRPHREVFPFMRFIVTCVCGFLSVEITQGELFGTLRGRQCKSVKPPLAAANNEVDQQIRLLLEDSGHQGRTCQSCQEPSLGEKSWKCLVYTCLG